MHILNAINEDQIASKFATTLTFQVTYYPQVPFSGLLKNTTAQTINGFMNNNTYFEPL